MNKLTIYSNNWFVVENYEFVEDAPCAQCTDFWRFNNIEDAEKKLKELWKSYKVTDYRNRR